jgi:hypothetical protein
MRTRISRAPRRSSALLAAGLLCLTMSLGASTAFGGSGQDDGGHGHGHGNGNGHGGGNGGGGGGGGGSASADCNYYYEWIGRVRFPLQPDPHATYSYVMPANQAALDGIGFLVRGEFPHSTWTSWMAYTGTAQPFDVANFVNNPPANTNNPVVADAGSVNPFVAGQPMLGTPRNFTLLWKPSGYTGTVAPSLDGTSTAAIPAANLKAYPAPDNGNEGNFWVLANRNYQALPGYNPGGSTESTFPHVTAVNLATGNAVDCQDYNQIPDRLQSPPTNPPDELNYGFVPVALNLKNGTRFTLIGGLGGGGQSQFAPTSPPGTVKFTRPPLLPGGDVATIPPPQNCSGYLGSRISTTEVSLIRIPRIANYTNNLGVTPATLYPNAVDAGTPWQASYTSLVMYGTSPGFYLPGDPRTTTVAGPEYKVDATGGSTVLVWPRTMNLLNRIRVWRYANEQGWAIIRGGTEGRQSSANMLLRVKGSASDYGGRLSNVPCYFGTPSAPENADAQWQDVPVQAGSEFVASPANLGTAAPQGVTCRTVRELTSGRCVDDLKSYIASTGGSYFAAP